MLDEHREDELDHLAVEGLVDERQADVEVDRAVFVEIVFEDLILAVELVEEFLDFEPFCLRNARDDLRADEREDARVDEDGHREDLPVGLDARAEDDRVVVVVDGLRAEHVDVALHEEFLELQRFRILLDAALFLCHSFSIQEKAAHTAFF